MYSVILLTAMTTAEAPSFGDMWAKHCFWECCWPARYGWVPCGGGLPYYPTPYYSCHGCGYFHYNSCHGCGCYGWGYGYGYAGCLSLGGCWSPCYSCYGGGSGSGIYQGVGYAGFSAYGNFGNYGMVPYIGAPAFAPPVISVQPVGNSTQLESKPVPSRPQVELNRTGTASIVVKVPAEAKVFVNDYQMKSTSTERSFTSPELDRGRDYYYTIRVAVEKNGKTVEDSRRVLIRAGETSSLAFDNLDRPRDDGRAIVGTKP